MHFNERPDIYLNNKKINVFSIKQETDWLVLYPLSLYKGDTRLRLVSQTSKHIQVHLIDIKPSQYKKQFIKVKNKQHVRASKSTLKRIRKEFFLKKKMYAVFTKSYINSVKMIKPLDSDLRHDFGCKRYFNGVAKSPHAGIDLSGKRGDKIKAPLSGTVRILGNLFYNGNMMVIDHGQGLITAYSHLSKFYKKEGEWINQGDYLGEVGSSGRATGPHLHWSVYLNSEPINPDLFLEDASL